MGFEPILRAAIAHVLPLHKEHHNTKLVDRVGLEPTTLGLKVRYSSQLS